MAVTFDSSFYDGPTTEKQRAETWMGPQYGVRGAGDWAVTAVSGSDRTVSISAGSGFGHGLADTTTTNDTIQLDTIASGSRWDLIVVRRNWQPVNGGPTAFVKINGSSTKGLPAVGTSATAWNRRPGIMDDQPIALVQVTAGQTQPTAIIDLRCWAANGGVLAVDKLALDYLNVPGADVHIGGIDYRYKPDSLGVFAWEGRETMFAEWNAQTTVVLSNTAGATRYVNFPAGMFTVPPLIQLTKADAAGAKLTDYYDKPTTSGVIVGLYSGDGSTYNTSVPVTITAKQTAPNRAGGINP